MADESTPTETSATEASDVSATDATVVEQPKDGAPAQDDAPADAEPTALGGDAPDEGDGAEGDGAGEEGGPPETYELTPPDGFSELDPVAMEAATPVFKELGLSNDQAQKLIPVAGEFAKKVIADRDAEMLGSIAEQRKDWLETAKADEEIGGANWDRSLADAARALDQLGFPKGSPLRNLLNESGLGNHPEMIRLAAKVGKAIGEDSEFVRAGHNASVKKTDAELFYGDGAAT